MGGGGGEGVGPEDPGYNASQAAERGRSPWRLVQAPCPHLSHSQKASCTDPASFPPLPASLSPGHTYQHLSVLSTPLWSPPALRPPKPPRPKTLLSAALVPHPGPSGHLPSHSPNCADHPSACLSSPRIDRDLGLDSPEPPVASHLLSLLFSPLDCKRRSKELKLLSLFFTPPPHPTPLSSHQPSLALSFKFCPHITHAAPALWEGACGGGRD